MSPAELEALPETRELRQVLTDLSLVSHVRGASYDSSGGGRGAEDSSGATPPGGPDRAGDRAPDFRQKTQYHFLNRYGKLLQAMSHGMSDERARANLDEILSDARDALRAWRKSPTNPGQDPEKGTRAWKIRIANDPRPSRQVATHHGISHVSVLRYRQQYEGVTE